MKYGSYTNPKKVNVNFILNDTLQRKGFSMKVGGYYEQATINVSTAFVLLHEYVHFIYTMTAKEKQDWVSELLAYYYEKTSILNMKYFYPAQLESCHRKE